MSVALGPSGGELAVWLMVYAVLGMFFVWGGGALMDAVMERGSLVREARSVAAGLVAEQRRELGSLLGPESPFQVLHRAKLAAAEQCAMRMAGAEGPYAVGRATVYGIAYRLLLDSCVRMNVRIAARLRAGLDGEVAR